MIGIWLGLGSGLMLGLVLVFKTSRCTFSPHAEHAHEHGTALHVAASVCLNVVVRYYPVRVFVVYFSVVD